MEPDTPLPGTPADYLARESTSSDQFWLSDLEVLYWPELVDQRDVPGFYDTDDFVSDTNQTNHYFHQHEGPARGGSELVDQREFAGFYEDNFVSDTSQTNHYFHQHEGPAQGGSDFEPSCFPIQGKILDTDFQSIREYEDKTDHLSILPPVLLHTVTYTLVPPLWAPGMEVEGNVYDGTSITTSNPSVPFTSHDGTSIAMSNSFVQTDLVLPSTSHHVPSSSSLELILHDQSSRPRDIPLHYLKQITDNFSDKRILGEGGSGVVYKGVLPNGEMIAVKKTVTAFMPGLQKQFENEVYHLMMLRHPNIVRCVGYCYETKNVCLEHDGKHIFAETAERLLCLEYLPNRSLDKYISDESSGLDWSTRYKIIVGVCYGLCHLHDQSGKPIIHLDLKPANILLDDGMTPKITDFGLSRLLDQEKTIYTKSRDGTLGYMAPEFLHGGTITPKSDIFSLGVIIIEVVTGHRDYPDVTRTSSDGFIKLVLNKWRNVLEESSSWFGSVEKDCQKIERCIQIGLICVHHDRTKRPSIAEIIHMLQGMEMCQWFEGSGNPLGDDAEASSNGKGPAGDEDLVLLSGDDDEYV